MKNILIVFLIALHPLVAFCQGGTVSDNLSMPSKILKSDRKFAVYFPPGYATSARSYPVLYLLHGSGDDHTGWVQFGEVVAIADKAITDGTATAMIIVMPDANTGKKGYVNDAKGEWRYEDFFFTELMPYIEKTYRVKTEKRYRAVAGLSMGGHGSFIYALHHPELFSSACPLSAWMGEPTFESIKERTLRESPGLSDSVIMKYYRYQNVIELIKSVPDDQKKAVRWYIDCGDDDFLSEGNSLAHVALLKKQITHEFRMRDGAHNWTYWRAALPTVLEFVSMSFHQY